ncbi:hypothetical protein TthHB5008_b22600 (plasmid) [Thermus thermophilus]|uniref:type I-G CRISPR-associated helicase/endonuclease Cas3g n=1 Tax=Thermus thermophilus TaxID=274 RepID=UPI00192D078A|nr:type I-U CRISPR-associated helicase/endonuclease Cas3 [Thermus thermophilus]BCP99188.1 hypothetical protein TthHB5002_b22910 [Thermus thermophilus]BCQ01490.1 hypothetical protein TthHB5008_b22600 [Thermus thermophilus]
MEALERAFAENPLTLEDFPGFFLEATGHEPYPWQEGLLRQVVQGGWPEAVAVPTGAGKTMVLVVALFLMALDPKAHRRVVYVVNRRLVVDQAYEVALGLQERLEEALARPSGEATPLVRAARRLAALGGGKPLEVVRLRGGVPRPRPTLQDPARPAVVLATVDMAGSRLLFRGYGVSRGLLPVEGALFGTDALYLLDEAHLEAPFLATLEAVAGSPGPWGRPGVRAVALTATPEGLGRGGVFRLGEADARHPRLGRILAASRRVWLRESPSRSRGKDLVAHALRLGEELGGPVAVVANRVGRALEVYRELGRAFPGRVLLLTGRMRPHERDRNFARTRALQERLDRGEVAFVVATQALEVGADLDFAGMVTELADLSALTQRLGRVNRRGQRERAEVVVLGEGEAEAKEARPYLPEALRATWAWLAGLGAEGGVDLSPKALAQRMEAQPPPPEAFGRPRPPMPFFEAFLPLLAHTDPLVPLDPDPFLHGLERAAPEVEVVWRADLPETAEEVEAYLEAAPPGPKEGVRLPLYAVRAWLRGGAADLADLEGQEEEALRPGPPREGKAFRFDGEGVEEVSLRDPRLRPGDVLLVPAGFGGLSEGHWDPEAREPVPDVAEWGEERPRFLRLHPKVLAQALEDPEGAEGFGQELKERLLGAEGRREAREEVRRFLEERLSDFRAEWRPLVQAFLEGPFEVWPWGEGWGYGGYVLRLRQENPLYGSGRPEALEAHSRKVAEAVEDFARRLGLDPGVRAPFRRSALWHDLGKQDARMQFWFLLSAGEAVDPSSRPLAKSGTRLTRKELERLRKEAGYPPGQRHEHVAARPLLGSHPLEAHLVATHHGRGRPLPAPSPDAPGFSVPLWAPWASWPGPPYGESAHGLERLESGYLENFLGLLKGMGPWGLAYGEALLRLADYLASGGEA